MFDIGERQTYAAHVLIRLVPLAGQQDHVLYISLAYCPGDRCGTVDFDFAPGHAGNDVGDDILWLFAARIVAGHQRAIGQALGQGAHLRTLALVAIATATEDNHQAATAAPRHGTQGDQGVFQRIRRMGVINDNQRLADSTHTLHAARRRRHFRQAARHVVGR